MADRAVAAAIDALVAALAAADPDAAIRSTVGVAVLPPQEVVGVLVDRVADRTEAGPARPAGRDDLPDDELIAAVQRAIDAGDQPALVRLAGGGYLRIVTLLAAIDARWAM